MVNISWCCKQKDGIKLIEPNDNLAQAYSQMAEDAIGTMNREKNQNLIFGISACYYSMYYSLYSIMIKLGVKCEIHSCRLEFMRQFLLGYYSQEDLKLIKKSFDLRSLAQYYPSKIIKKEDSDFIISQAPIFLNKSKEILLKINQKDIEKIRGELSKAIKN
ncbi:MAG: hypothetical protein NT076_02420 [Candidatus Pacearchaeota archaeon]|nr:hypothetical protein [Candidatus Pacearchaeota archaeon]